MFKTEQFETVSTLKLAATADDDGKEIFCEVSNHLVTTPLVAGIKLQLKHVPRVTLSYDNKILEVNITFNKYNKSLAFNYTVCTCTIQGNVYSCLVFT